MIEALMLLVGGLGLRWLWLESDRPNREAKWRDSQVKMLQDMENRARNYDMEVQRIKALKAFEKYKQDRLMEFYNYLIDNTPVPYAKYSLIRGEWILKDFKLCGELYLDERTMTINKAGRASLRISIPVVITSRNRQR